MKQGAIVFLRVCVCVCVCARVHTVMLVWQCCRADPGVCNI